jgi:hypothetical protein
MSGPATGLESAFHATHRFLIRSETRHLFIGGLAVMASGEPRMTRDIDLIIFVPREALPGFLAKASRNGFKTGGRKNLTDVLERGSCTIIRGSVAIDLILASTDLEDSAWRRRRRRKIFGRMVFVPSPEDMILLKIIPGRPRDIEDVRNIVASTGNKLDRAYIRKWAERLCDRAEDMRYFRRLEEVGALPAR